MIRIDWSLVIWGVVWAYVLFSWWLNGTGPNDPYGIRP
jgi:hypothetical protein